MKESGQFVVRYNMSQTPEEDSFCHLQGDGMRRKPTFTLIVPKSHVVSVIEEFPMALSCSPINLFLNLLGDPRSPLKAPGVF